MKIAITGHTSGIGKALFTMLSEQGHDVSGFSRSNGYDIDVYENRQALLTQIIDYDVFINNAYSPGQTDMLSEIINLWEDKDKLIINLSSKATMMDFVLPGEENYVTEKQLQNQILNERLFKPFPQITNLIIGLTDTPMTDKLVGKKLQPCKIASIVEFLITNQQDFAMQQLVIDVPKQHYSDIKLLS